MGDVNAIFPEPKPKEGLQTTWVRETVEKKSELIYKLLQLNFVSCHDDEISIDISKIPSSKEIRSFLDSVFSSGLYIPKINLKNVQTLLYRFDEVKTTVWKENPHYSIGSWIEVIRNAELYEGVLEIKDVKIKDSDVSVAEYTFQNDPRSNAWKLKADEFIGILWQKWVKYGFSRENIQRQFLGMNQGVWIVAEGCAPGTTKHANKFIRIDPAPQKKLAVDDKGKAMEYQYVFPYVEVPEGQSTVILMKIPGIQGSPGYKVDGTVIPAKEPEDFDLKSLCGEGTRHHVNSNKTESLIAVMSGYILVNAEVIEVSERVTNSLNVGRETGNIRLSSKWLTQNGSVEHGYKVFDNEVTITGNHIVEWEVCALNGPCTIGGTVNGWTVHSEWSQAKIDIKGKVINNAKIYSSEGDIVLEYAEKAVIVAWGKITIGKAVDCHIVGREVIVTNEIVGGTVVSPCCSINKASSGKNLPEILFPLYKISRDEQKIAFLQMNRERLENEIPKLKQHIADLSNDPGMVKYVSLLKFARDRKNLTVEQGKNLDEALKGFAKQAKLLEIYSRMLKVLKLKEDDLERRTELLNQEELALQAQTKFLEESCQILVVSGKINCYGYEVESDVFQKVVGTYKEHHNGNTEPSEIPYSLALSDLFHDKMTNKWELMSRWKMSFVPFSETLSFENIRTVFREYQEQNKRKPDQENISESRERWAERRNEARIPLMTTEEIGEVLDKKTEPNWRFVETQLDAAFTHFQADYTCIGHLTDYSSTGIGIFFCGNPGLKSLADFIGKYNVMPVKFKLCDKIVEQNLKIVNCHYDETSDSLRIGGFFEDISLEDSQKLSVLRNKIEWKRRTG